MKTLKVDEQKRVRLPDALPRQVYVYDRDADGTIRLLPVVVKQSSPPKVKLIRRGGRTFAETDRTITNEDVQRVMETFP